MEGFFSVFTVELLNSGIRLATPILLAALGGASATRLEYSTWHWKARCCLELSWALSQLIT